MKRSAIFFGLSILAICLSATTVMQATPIDPPTAGSTGLNDAGFATTADGSRNGNINTSTMFAYANFQVGPGGSGVFASLVAQQFGPVSFDSAVGTSLMFSNSTFGSFASSSIMVVNNVPSFLNLLVAGVWNPGSAFPGLPAGVLTNVTLTFTQFPPTSGDVTGSGSFASTNTIIPEPASMALFGTGLVGLGGVIRRRMMMRK